MHGYYLQVFLYYVCYLWLAGVAFSLLLIALLDARYPRIRPGRPWKQSGRQPTHLTCHSQSQPQPWELRLIQCHQRRLHLAHLTGRSTDQAQPPTW